MTTVAEGGNRRDYTTLLVLASANSRAPAGLSLPTCQGLSVFSGMSEIISMMSWENVVVSVILFLMLYLALIVKVHFQMCYKVCNK